MCATYYARTSDHGYETCDKPKPPLSATGVNVTAISVAVMALASAATVLLTISAVGAEHDRCRRVQCSPASSYVELLHRVP